MKQIRLIAQQFDGNSKSVAVSTSAPAPSLLNSLTSHGTDVPDADGERERRWKTVQGERKRFVSFSVPKTWTSDGLGGAFRSAGKVFNHSGTLNSSHRLIVASADLLHEEGDEPWLSLQSPASNLWKDIVTFCSSASGNTDFVMLLMDGCGRFAGPMNLGGRSCSFWQHLKPRTLFDLSRFHVTSWKFSKLVDRQYR